MYFVYHERHLINTSVPYPQPLFKVLQSRAVLVVEHAR